MTKWELAVLCFGMVLLILATTAHAAGPVCPPRNDAAGNPSVPASRVALTMPSWKAAKIKIPIGN